MEVRGSNPPELIDGRAGPDHDKTLDEPAWRKYVAQIQAAADTFATTTDPAKPTDQPH